MFYLEVNNAPNRQSTLGFITLWLEWKWKEENKTKKILRSTVKRKYLKKRNLPHRVSH